MKLTFRVASGKLLGFVVRYWGIKIDSDKIKTYKVASSKKFDGAQIPSRETRHIIRFISNLSGSYMSFGRLMKKSALFMWDQKCQ